MRKLHNDDLGKLLLRLLIAGQLLFHGIGKVQGGIDPIIRMIESHGLPRFIAYGVYLGEVAAPALVIIGWFTRPAALVMVINMVVAVLLVHTGDLLLLDEMGSWKMEKHTFYFVGSLAIFFLGAGRYSVSRGQGVWD